MEGQQYRGRSSSAGHHPNHIRHSPSPQHYHDQSPRLDLDPSISNTTFNTGPFNNNVPTAGSGPDFNAVPQSFYQGTPQSLPFQQHVLPSNDFSDGDFAQKYQQDGVSPNPDRRSSQLNIQQLRAAGAPTSFEDFDHQQKTLAQSYESDFQLEPQFQPSIQQQASINPADLMSNMSSPQNLMPTPPNMISSDPNSPPGQASLASDQNHHYSPNHSRQASLDPSSAHYIHGQQGADWTNMLGGVQFQTHQRAPSEHSDVSSSVAPSPFLATQESFESYDANPSPMLNAQQDHGYLDALGIEQFSLTDGQQNHQRISPAHSPFVSPRMSPHAGLGFNQDNFILGQNNFGSGPGPEIYTSQAEDQYNHPRLGSGDMGQAASMAPPEINVELAPPSRQPNFDSQRPEHDLDALQPPDRGKGSLILKIDNTNVT